MLRILSTLSVFSVVAILTLDSCSSGKAAFERGDYYQAVVTAVGRLRKDPGNKKSTETLRLAYPLAVNYYEGQVNAAITSTTQFKWAQVVNSYTSLNSMYDEIQRSPGALAVIPNATNYNAKLNEARQNAAKEQYDAGILALGAGTRDKAKEAYGYFKRSMEFIVGYRDAAQKMEEALWAATVKVLVEPIPVDARNLSVSADFFNDRVSEYLHTQNSNQFVRFFTTKEAQGINLSPDHIVRLTFDEFTVGNVYMSEKQIPLQRDSVVVATYVNNVVNQTTVINNTTVNNNTTNNSTTNNTTNNNTNNTTINNTTNSTSNNTVNNTTINNQSNSNSGTSNTGNQNQATTGNNQTTSNTSQNSQSGQSQNTGGTNQNQGTPTNANSNTGSSNPTQGNQNTGGTTQNQGNQNSAPVGQGNTNNSGNANQGGQNQNTGNTNQNSGNLNRNNTNRGNQGANTGNQNQSGSNQNQGGDTKNSGNSNQGNQNSGGSNQNQGNSGNSGNQGNQNQNSGNPNQGNPNSGTSNQNQGNPDPNQSNSENQNSGNSNGGSGNQGNQNQNSGNTNQGNQNSGASSQNQGNSNQNQGNSGNQNSGNANQNNQNQGNEPPIVADPIPANEQVTVCHIPQGNPAGRHSLTIAKSALKAHLDHGDVEGACEDPKNAEKLKELDKKGSDKKEADKKEGDKKSDDKKDAKDNKGNGNGGFVLNEYSPVLIASASNDRTWQSIFSYEALADTNKVYASVKATLFYYAKTIQSKGVVNFSIIDARTNAVLSVAKMPGEYLWKSEWATYNGDERALNQQHKQLVQMKEQVPPSYQELFQAFTNPIFDQAMQKIQEFYKHY